MCLRQKELCAVRSHQIMQIWIKQTKEQRGLFPVRQNGQKKKKREAKIEFSPGRVFHFLLLSKHKIQSTKTKSVFFLVFGFRFMSEKTKDHKFSFFYFLMLDFQLNIPKQLLYRGWYTRLATSIGQKTGPRVLLVLSSLVMRQNCIYTHMTKATGNSRSINCSTSDQWQNMCNQWNLKVPWICQVVINFLCLL